MRNGSARTCRRARPFGLLIRPTSSMYCEESHQSDRFLRIRSAGGCELHRITPPYSGILHVPAPFPAIIKRLRERAEALSGASFNAALANLYRTGHDSVGWHSDNEAGLGNRPIIASLSLGGERRFQFRHRETKQTITLGLRMGHWLIMAGETQRFWVHQVPKTATAVAPRVNLTFRHIVQ